MNQRRPSVPLGTIFFTFHFDFLSTFSESSLTFRFSAPIRAVEVFKNVASNAWGTTSVNAPNNRPVTSGLVTDSPVQNQVRWKSVHRPDLGAI